MATAIELNPFYSAFDCQPACFHSPNRSPFDFSYPFFFNLIKMTFGGENITYLFSFSTFSYFNNPKLTYKHHPFEIKINSDDIHVICILPHKNIYFKLYIVNKNSKRDETREHQRFVGLLSLVLLAISHWSSVVTIKFAIRRFLSYLSGGKFVLNSHSVCFWLLEVSCIENSHVLKFAKR